jgi:Tol biopolymer transport system component
MLAIGVLLAISGDGKADFKYGTPINLGPTVNSPVWDNEPRVTPDGLSLFFTSDRPGGYGGFDVWVTKRETIQDPWGQPVNAGPTINSADNEGCGSISADCLEFYIYSDRSGGIGNWDIWVATRETIQDPWSDLVNLGSTINSGNFDLGGNIASDGLSFFFNSSRSGGSGSQDLWVSTRPTVSDPWGEPENLGSSVNSGGWDYSPALSSDGLKLFFSSNRPSEHGDWAIWVTERATKDDDWGPPINLGPVVNSGPEQENPYISLDGSTLYFGSTRPGNSGGVDLWQASIEPIVDLNGDGIVDAADMCIIVDNWGTDNSLCDIGPMPWGDGVVDVEDLIVLAEHLFEEIPPAEEVE